MSKIRVRKRGSTYYFSFEAGRKPDGKRRTIEHGGYDDEQAAYDAGVKAYTDWKHGEIGITTERVSVAEYLESYVNVREPELRRSSVAMYRSTFRQINRYVGGIVLQDLRPRDVDSMLRRMLADGLARKSLSTIKSIFKTALDYAVYPAELISSNPVAAIKVPRGGKEHVIKRTVIGDRLLRHLLTESFPEGHYMHIWCLIAYHTGMRVSEICGLTWSDVDFNTGLLRISRQIVATKGFVGFGPPKTPSSEREIYLDRKILAELKKWQREQMKQRMAAGYKYMLVFKNDDDSFSLESQSTTRQNPVNLIITQPNGKHCTSYHIISSLRPEGINSHSFRHTHTTLLAEDTSVSPKALAARLGHKNVDTTQNVYTHVTDKMREDTVNSFQKIVDKIS